MWKSIIDENNSIFNKAKQYSIAWDGTPSNSPFYNADNLMSLSLSSKHSERIKLIKDRMESSIDLDEISILKKALSIEIQWGISGSGSKEFLDSYYLSKIFPMDSTTVTVPREMVPFNTVEFLEKLVEESEEYTKKTLKKWSSEDTKIELLSYEERVRRNAEKFYQDIDEEIYLIYRDLGVGEIKIYKLNVEPEIRKFFKRGLATKYTSKIVNEMGGLFGSELQGDPFAIPQADGKYEGDISFRLLRLHNDRWSIHLKGSLMSDGLLDSIQKGKFSDEGWGMGIKIIIKRL